MRTDHRRVDYPSSHNDNDYVSGGRIYYRVEEDMTDIDEKTIDYTLKNPDTLTKYKTAAQISHKVLEAVTGTAPKY